MLGVVVLLEKQELAFEPQLGVGRTWVLWLSHGSGASRVGIRESFF